jgi:hypothetical protein
MNMHRTLSPDNQKQHMSKSLTADPPKDFCLMLVGSAGSGKSTLAARFPAPFFLSLDKNLRGPAAVMVSENKTDITYEDNFDKDDEGKAIPPGLQFKRFADVLAKACQDPYVKTIVLDNTTLLSDLIMNDILLQQGRKTPEIRDWGLYGAAWKQLLAKLRLCGKNVIVISHERLEKDELDGTLKYFLAVPGQTADLLPTLVTDVWRCEVEEQLVGRERKHVRQVRTIQSQRHAHLKASTPSMPTVFPATTENVNKVLATLTP